MASLAPTLPARRVDAGQVTGRVFSGVAVAMLLLDAGMKLAAPALMIANTPPLGLPAEIGFYRTLGALLLGCTLFYAWPRTAVIGAVLLTGYLGGAVAINLRAGMPLGTHTLFGIYIGALVWGGLYLRDPALRALLAPPSRTAR